MNKYRCIHCNSPVNALYTQYTEEIIKMERCSECGNVSDKYIEYDIFLVSIDLLIGRLEAFRHVIYNTSDFSIQKLLCLSLLLNAFVFWLSEQPTSSVDLANLSISFSSDLYVHVVSDLWWFLCFSSLLTIPYYFSQSTVTFYSFAKVLLIVNFSRLLTFFFMTWKKEFYSFFTNTLSFYPFVSTMVALTPCIQSLRALTDFNFITGFFIGALVCVISLMSSVHILPFILSII